MRPCLNFNLKLIFESLRINVDPINDFSFIGEKNDDEIKFPKLPVFKLIDDFALDIILNFVVFKTV